MDRYERMRIRRRERVLREQEELVDPHLAVGSDRTQRQGNALTWRASLGRRPSQALLSCLQHLGFVRRKWRRVAAVRGARYH